MSKSIHEITKRKLVEGDISRMGHLFKRKKLIRQLCFKERLHSGGLVVQAFG